MSYRAPRRRPHLFTGDEITTLMTTAAASARTAQRAVMLQTLIGLLAVTGMRVGEALRLTDADIDTDTALITIRATKFNKSRHVPVTASTIDCTGVIRADPRRGPPIAGVSTGVRVRRRDPGRLQPLLPHLRSGRRCCRHRRPGSAVRPRIHDLRHSFAVRTLVDWHRAGDDVAAMLPRLSTYLGHREPRYTYRYLSATPELLGHAAALLEAAQAATR